MAIERVASRRQGGAALAWALFWPQEPPDVLGPESPPGLLWTRRSWAAQDPTPPLGHTSVPGGPSPAVRHCPAGLRRSHLGGLTWVTAGICIQVVLLEWAPWAQPPRGSSQCQAQGLLALSRSGLGSATARPRLAGRKAPACAGGGGMTGAGDGEVPAGAEASCPVAVSSTTPAQPSLGHVGAQSTKSGSQQGSWSLGLPRPPPACLAAPPAQQPPPPPPGQWTETGLPLFYPPEPCPQPEDSGTSGKGPGQVTTPRKDPYPQLSPAAPTNVHGHGDQHTPHSDRQPICDIRRPSYWVPG